MNAKQLLLRFAEYAANQPTPYCLAGHNGPYCDSETLVRNNSHWLYTFAKCFEWTHIDLYMAEAIKLADILCSKDARPYGYTFLYRNNPKKDRCNGLIGQAWSIDALSEAGTILCIDRYCDTAKDVFLLHPQNFETGLWHSVEVNGEILPQHRTLNQQLWFAASGIKLMDNTSRGKTITDRINLFLQNLPEIFSIGASGIINQDFNCYGRSRRMKQWTKNKLYNLSDLIQRSKTSLTSMPLYLRNNYEQRVYDHAVGYHAFSLCAIADLKKAFADAAFWNSRAFKKALAYLDSAKFKIALEHNRFACQYNPVGFHAAYTASVLFNQNSLRLHQQISNWVNFQLDNYFCYDSMKMVLNTTDPNTLNARMCELARMDPLLLTDIPVNA